MYYKISNTFDVEMLKKDIDYVVSDYNIDASKIIKSISEYIEILEEHYGQEQIACSAGGVLLFFSAPVPKETFKAVLEYYHLKEEFVELHEIICWNKEMGMEFVRELYALTEFHIILVYPRECNNR